MDKYKYKASITHTEKTVRELYKTQYFCFDKVRIIIRFIAGFLLILAAVSFEIRLTFKGILLLTGTWLVSTPDFPSQVKADKNLDARKIPLPVISYEFYDSFMRLNDGETCDINYEKIKILIKDKNYLYLFMSKNSACMIDKLTIDNLDAFINFMEEKTKIKWRVQKSFFSMNFHDLLKSFNSITP